MSEKELLDSAAFELRNYEFTELAAAVQRVANDAESHVRVPRANLTAMLQYVDTYLRKARQQQTQEVPVLALCTVGDDIEGWLRGEFKAVPEKSEA